MKSICQLFNLSNSKSLPIFFPPRPYAGIDIPPPPSLTVSTGVGGGHDTAPPTAPLPSEGSVINSDSTENSTIDVDA